MRGRRAGGAAMADLRARLVASTLATGGADRGGRRAGELAALAMQGGAAVERWAGRALPQVALAALVPVAALAVIVVRDPLSAALLAPTLPLLIVFLVLAGGDARRVADERFAAMSLLGAHLLDVTRGLPVLRSLGRAEVQREQLAIAGDAYRRTTVAHAALGVRQQLRARVRRDAGDRARRRRRGGAARQRGDGVRGRAGRAPARAGDLRPAAARWRRVPRGGRRAGDAAAAARGHRRAPRVAPGRRPAAVADPREHAIVLDARHGRPRPGRSAGRSSACRWRSPPGEATALVGPSGAGKSTAAARPARTAADRRPEPVRCGGRELAAMDLEAWRAQIAWMPQRPVLLPGDAGREPAPRRRGRGRRAAVGGARRGRAARRGRPGCPAASRRAWARAASPPAPASGGASRSRASRCAIPRSSSSTSRPPTSTR